MPDLVSTLVDKISATPETVRLGSIHTDVDGQYLALDFAKLYSYLRLSNFTPVDGTVVLCVRVGVGVVVLGRVLPNP